MGSAYRPETASAMASSSVAKGMAGGTPAAQGTNTINVGKEFDQVPKLGSHSASAGHVPFHSYGSSGKMATGSSNFPHTAHDPRFSAASVKTAVPGSNKGLPKIV